MSDYSELEARAATILAGDETRETTGATDSPAVRGELQACGPTLELVARPNGRARYPVTIRLHDGGLLAHDVLDLSAAAAREKLADQVPEEYRSELEQLALEIGVAAAQRPTRCPPATSPTLWPALDPWPEPVRGVALADSVVAAFRRYLILPHPSDYDALALWVLFAHAHDAFDYSPLLVLTSPERASGKSRVLDVLACLVPRPWPVLNPSDAALYRVIEKHRPTLLLDEADNIDWKTRGELLALLNGGFKRMGSVIPRCVGDGATLDVKEFSVWCPKAFASLKVAALPDTTLSRSIVLSLRRKLPSERVAKFRASTAEAELRPLAGQAARWGADGLHALRVAQPVPPEKLSDRAADAWEPLFAVADALGGTWPERARSAALALAGGAAAPVGAGEMLLAHIRDVFDSRGTDVVSSAAIVLALTEIEGAPWSEWGRRGFTPNALARQLRPFSIGPRTVRIGAETPKGYHRDQFVDAWARYLAPNRHTATPDGTQAVALLSEPPQPAGTLRLQNGANPFVVNERGGVAVENAPPGGVDGDALPPEPEF